MKTDPIETWHRLLKQKDLRGLDVLLADDAVFHGVDMIRWNDAGQITDFKVMLRPLKAINLVHEKMGAMLQAMK